MAKTKKAEVLTLEEKLQQALVPQEEQPYRMPANWCWTKLEYIAKWGSGGTPSRKKAEYYNGSIPWIKTGELNCKYIYGSEEHITESAIKNSNAKVYPVNTVVLAMYGATIGKVSILKIEAATNQACACAIGLKSIYYMYLFYFLQNNKYRFILKGKGGAQPNISQDIIKKEIFPLPPLSEQQRIVDRIESIFAKLDEAKERAQEVVDGFEERKAAILHKAFIGELTAKWRAEHGIGMDSWEANELKDFLEPMENKKPKGEKFRYIDIDSIDNINQIVKEPKIIMVKDAPSRASRGLKTNDIVFSMVRPYLKNIAYIYEELSDCIASTGFYVCRCNKKLLPQFLFKFLCSKDAIDYLMKYMKGDNSPSIRQNDLLGMPVLFPKPLEQIEITKILNSILSQEQHAKEAAESVLEQIDLIKKSILAKAFRGELGTNNPEEESAVELLKACLQEK